MELFRWFPLELEQNRQPAVGRPEEAIDFLICQRPAAAVSLNRHKAVRRPLAAPALESATQRAVKVAAFSAVRAGDRSEPKLRFCRLRDHGKPNPPVAHTLNMIRL